MKIWIVNKNDDDGVNAEVHYSEASAQTSAHNWVHKAWDGPGMPDDWRQAFDELNETLGFMDSISLEEIKLDLEQLLPGVTKQDLEAITDLPTDSEGRPCVFLNEYRCDGGTDVPTHDVEWSNRWTCACDDTCPHCGDSVSPHTFTIQIGSKPVLGEFWDALPDTSEVSQ